MPSSDRSNRVVLPVVGTEGLRQLLSFSRSLVEFAEVIVLGVVLTSGDAGRMPFARETCGAGFARSYERERQDKAESSCEALSLHPRLCARLCWTSSPIFFSFHGPAQISIRGTGSASVMRRFVRAVGDGHPSRVLLAARGGPQAELAMELALRLATCTGAQLTVMHIDRTTADDESRERERRLFRSLVARCRRRIPVRQRTFSGDDVAGAILGEASHHDVLVMGAGLARRGEPVLGALAETVARDADCATIVVKTGTPVDPILLGKEHADRRHRRSLVCRQHLPLP